MSHVNICNAMVPDSPPLVMQKGRLDNFICTQRQTDQVLNRLATKCRSNHAFYKVIKTSFNVRRTRELLIVNIILLFFHL